ncbi:carbohydrate-binding protein [[Ruminococcus] torques]
MPWEQPNSTNPYKKGDRVTHKGKTWESLVDSNVWEPGAVGSESLWKEVA